jgi:hypothetical protein
MRETKEIREVKTKLGVHKIYYGPPETYLDKRMSLEAIFGTGLFDNRIGKMLHKLTFLSFFDVTTARFWKLKNNLFLKFRLPD